MLSELSLSDVSEGTVLSSAGAVVSSLSGSVVSSVGAAVSSGFVSSGSLSGLVTVLEPSWA